MVAVELEGKNLSEKHKNYNKLVKCHVTDVDYKLDDFNVNEDDITNLVKIDIASEKRNLEYILKVLVCDDMLYISRAINKCNWLITEQEYAYIINAEFLHSDLYKRMTTRAVNKLRKYIILHLKDSVRLESFYRYEKEPSKAVKWLPNSSPEFIEANVIKHIDHLNITLLKKLCEKTIKVLELFIENYKGHKYSTKEVLECTMFLLNNDGNKYLNIVEKEEYYNRPHFGKRATAVLMKNAPQRIIEKYECYYKSIHLESFIKCLGSNNIKNFLFDQASKRENLNPVLFNRDSLNMFIKYMPEEERLDFVNKLFINKIHRDEKSLLASDRKAMAYIYDCSEAGNYAHRFSWFHVPFDVCFEYLKDTFKFEVNPNSVKKIFSTMITVTKQNQQNLNIVIQYFFEKYNSAGFDLKHDLIKDVTARTNFHRFDQRIWNIIENLMMEKSKLNYNNELYSKIIFIYKVLNGIEVPDIIYENINFTSLKSYKKILNEQEQKTLFDFLYNYITNKLKNHTLITNPEEFVETIETLEKSMDLLNDWDKNITHYPALIDLINNLVDIRKQNLWTTDMSSIYNKNKRWKRALFHNSFELCPSESVLINAIKHDAGIIQRNQQLDDLRFNDKKTITSFLKKIRIYWANSIGEEWKQAYFSNFDKLSGQKASTLGICVLLRRIELENVLCEYAPNGPKIDYNDLDEVKLNLQRNFAKNMHYARPQPIPETILLYAKGDYLQHALPALLSIFHNLNCMEGHNQILKMMNTQVSLQKHAIRLAFLKLTIPELSTLFTKVWETTQNSTLRSVLFKSVHELLCKENDHNKIDQLWKLLQTFIDNLALNENKIIYDLLLKVKHVPDLIKADFFMKSYYFLKKLVASDVKYDSYRREIDNNLILYVREIIELLPSEFVAEVASEFIETEFKVDKDHSYNFSRKTEMVSAYLLCAKDENIQLQKYDTLLRPLIHYCSELWKKGQHYIRGNLDLLLKNLREDLKTFIIDKKMVVPIKMFEMTQKELEELFVISENYNMLTKWKLSVAFISTLDGSHIDDWDESCQKAAPQFSELCLKYLKQNCKECFSRIYILFVQALEYILDEIKIENISLDICNNLIIDTDFVEGYLAAIKLLPDDIKCDRTSRERVNKLRQIIFNHPSAEVKMHYYGRFKKSDNNKILKSFFNTPFNQPVVY